MLRCKFRVDRIMVSGDSRDVAFSAVNERTGDNTGWSKSNTPIGTLRLMATEPSFFGKIDELREGGFVYLDLSPVTDEEERKEAKKIEGETAKPAPAKPPEPPKATPTMTPGSTPGKLTPAPSPGSPGSPKPPTGPGVPPGTKPGSPEVP